MREQRTEYFKNGGIRAQGDMLDGELDGYWEWFRLDGSKLRSGYFERGEQVGEWITYNAKGEVHKRTTMRPKKAPPTDA
jgi:antitoxin component YwqK of YwqJK toxin-antitoxin module